MIQLRDYQEHGVAETIAAIVDRGRPILCAPTGSGKTVCAVEIIRRFATPTLFLAHRREIIMQAAASLARGGLDVGAIMAGVNTRPRAQVQVASIQTLRRRPKPPVALVVLDECHHVRAQTYGEVLDAYPGVPLVGLSATPFRLDGRGLGNTFDQIIVAAYTDDLCANGTLVEPVVYAPAVPDLSGVHMQHGEFNLRELGDRMQKAKLVGDIVETWQKRAAGKRTVVYATNIEHSRQIETAFREAGVKVERLDGSTPKGQRDAILHRLRTAYTTIVCNVGVLEEGWDLPALDCAVIARPTASLCWHLQSIGRIMRACEGKFGATVLDHAGNHLRHGPVTQRIEYSLADKAGKKEPGEAPLKRCPDCFLVVALSASECPECGHVFASKGRQPEHEAGELVRYDPAAVTTKPRPTIEQQQLAWNVLEEQRVALGSREGWTFVMFKSRFGFTPLVWEGTVCDPETVGPDVRLGVFRNFEAAAAAKAFKPGWAAHRYRELFGVWPPFERRTA